MVVRLLGSMLAVLVFLPATASAAPASAAPADYAYGKHHHTASLSDIATEHRPPGYRYTYTSTLDAVDRGPDGTSACTDAFSKCTDTAYDDPGTSADGARATATTQEPVRVNHRIPLLLDRSQVAANSGTRSGLPRDALGRFTSGAGGESAAAAAGRTAHANYANTLGGGNYVFNRALPGSRLRPDAVDYSQNIVRELKPGTPSGISRGWRQVNEYKAYLEDLTGQPWTAQVDVYTP